MLCQLFCPPKNTKEAEKRATEIELYCVISYEIFFYQLGDRSGHAVMTIDESASYWTTDIYIHLS